MPRPPAFLTGDTILIFMCGKALMTWRRSTPSIRLTKEDGDVKMVSGMYADERQIRRVDVKDTAKVSQKSKPKKSSRARNFNSKQINAPLIFLCRLISSNTTCICNTFDVIPWENVATWRRINHVLRMNTCPPITRVTFIKQHFGHNKTYIEPRVIKW